MKRYIILFVSVVGLLLCLCGCRKESALKPEDSSAPVKTVEEKQEIESLTEKLIREIDAVYLKESELPEYETTVGMVELANKYTEEWQQTANYYYNKIMEYNGSVEPCENYKSLEEFHSYISAMKAENEANNEKMCKEYYDSLRSSYGEGSIVGPAFASYKYDLQKAWALKIVGIYESLNVE